MGNPVYVHFSESVLAVSLVGGMELWNGMVEWNSGMTTPTERPSPDDLSPIAVI